MEKLAALRQTLNADEQTLLDDMVANTSFDVEAHRVRIMPRDAEMDVVAHRFINPNEVTFNFNEEIGYEIAQVADGRIIRPRVPITMPK
jgi:hypothetical protein